LLHKGDEEQDLDIVGHSISDQGIGNAPGQDLVMTFPFHKIYGFQLELK
jgi:hypothetical protein